VRGVRRRSSPRRSESDPTTAGPSGRTLMIRRSADTLSEWLGVASRRVWLCGIRFEQGDALMIRLQPRSMAGLLVLGLVALCASATSGQPDAPVPPPIASVHIPGLFTAPRLHGFAPCCSSLREAMFARASSTYPVFLILAGDDTGDWDSGTGFYLQRPSGRWVVTANHVVEGANPNYIFARINERRKGPPTSH